MRFSLPILSILAASVVANPAALEAAKRDTTADAIKFAVEAAGCDIGQCGGVLAAAVCIALCLRRPTWSCITGCVEGGAGSVSEIFLFPLTSHLVPSRPS